MKQQRTLIQLFIMLITINACHPKTDNYRSISKNDLKDKIAGGWAGKMIGVTYGAPTEFHALGKTFEDSILWTPDDIKGSMWQDDIYVQLTFMMTMDQYGMDAPDKKFQEMFAKSGYMLWHANVQARKNYFDSIFPPASGNPEFNAHADDIDFQIEADYLGFMCPGMPNTANKMADKIGHIMNYGDGVYGGMFLAALYTHAFFENNIPLIINKALLSIPAESDYARIVSDVVKLHQHFPSDWRKAWKELQDKWGSDHFCGSGSEFNIDAKLNGAYIVMGLLYGEGDPIKTMEITTRCGQDSDCNPSNAMALLGVITGFEQLPVAMKKGVLNVSDSLFINTDYSFDKAVDKTYQYAIKLISSNGGMIQDQKIHILEQTPIAAALEVSFPEVVLSEKITVFESDKWSLTGNWQYLKKTSWDKKIHDQSLFASKSGDAIEISFTGTGISIDGNWVKDGGKADVYLDGEFIRSIDTYFNYSNQEHENITLWHITGLNNTKHHVKLLVKGEKRPESLGTKLYITQAVTYKTAAKKSDTFKFSFE